MEAAAPPKSTTSTPPSAPPAPPLLRRIATLDTTLSHRLHTLAQPFLPHALLLLLEYSADFRFFFPLSLSLLLGPTLSPDPSPIPGPLLLRPLLSPLILGLLLDLAFIGLIKFLVQRARPVYNKNMNVAVSVDHFSFPSGHASRVFFVAALFYLSAAAVADVLLHLRSTSTFVDRWIGGADQVKAVRVLASVVWGWAAATAVSRVFLGRHFILDVFAGACLGVLEALVAFHFLKF